VAAAILLLKRITEHAENAVSAELVGDLLQLIHRKAVFRQAIASQRRAHADFCLLTQRQRISGLKIRSTLPFLWFEFEGKQRHFTASLQTFAVIRVILLFAELDVDEGSLDV